MGKATGNTKRTTIRATRVEVVDHRGRVRVVLGVLGQGEDPIWGIAVRDETGDDRAWLVAEGRTAGLGLTFGGDVAASLGIGDDGKADLYLADD